jgi:hypothetical protein
VQRLGEQTPQRALALHAAHDEVGMFLSRTMKVGNRFGNSVTGLNDLLPWRKVIADDYIQIRDLVKHNAPPMAE